MTLTILIAFGALAVAAAISALWAPPGAPAERPFLPSRGSCCRICNTIGRKQG